jgi:hypothetical protein
MLVTIGRTRDPEKHEFSEGDWPIGRRFSDNGTKKPGPHEVRAGPKSAITWRIAQELGLVPERSGSTKRRRRMRQRR